MIRITIYFDGGGCYIIPDANQATADSVYQHIARNDSYVLLNDDKDRMIGKMFMVSKITHVTFDEVEIVEREDDIPF